MPHSYRRHQKRLMGQRLDVGQTLGERRQGRFNIPDRQGKMDPGLRGQLLYCPACGREHMTPLDCRLECQCGALWTLSAGQADTLDIVVVRLDRWR